MRDGEIWGGKWDDTFMVFFAFERTAGDEFKIRYCWQETAGGRIRKTTKNGVQNGAVVTVGPKMTVRTIGENGFVYGKFNSPRVARLVKLDIRDVEDISEDVLMDAGWKPNSIGKKAVETWIYTGQLPDEDKE